MIHVTRARSLLSILGCRWFLVLPILLGCSAIHAQVIYTYNNNTAAGILENNTVCATSTTMTFVVSETFTVANVAIGVDIAHEDRGQIQLRLTPPSSPEVTILATSADTLNNYRIMLSSNTEGVANDTDDDVAGGTIRYRRLVPFANAVNYTGTANGTWTLRICDTNTAGNAGTINSARLVLRSAETFPAACSAGNTIGFDWGANGALAAFTSLNVSGVVVSQGATSGEAPNDGDAANGAAATGIPSFITRTTTNGAHPGYYSINMNTTGDTETSLESTTFNFSEPVHGLTFNLLDVDLQGGANGWEDYARIEALGPLGEPRSIQVVPANAQLTYAGDWLESDASAPVDTNVGNATYTFSGPVSSITIQYAQGDEPNTNSTFQVIGVSDFSFCAFDFGDGPNTYGTLVGSNGAQHSLSYRTLFMGTAPDGDADGVPTAGATGDGADEDGITLPVEIVGPSPSFQCGSYITALGEFCVTVSVTNQLATAAQLVGFIDLNGDGDFNDANERSLPRLGGGTGGAGDANWTTGNIPANSTGNRVLVWSGITGNIANLATFIRARLSSDTDFFNNGTPPSPNGLVSDGEVEDFPVPAGTLPVTLTYVSSTAQGRAMRVSFATATETENVGFSIVERLPDGTFKPLHAHLVPSRNTNSTDRSQYTATDVALPTNGEFHIMDHDVRGRATVRGPFLVGATKGQNTVDAAIDWNTTRAAIQQSIAARGAAASTAILWVKEPGIHRVTAAQLASAGVAFAGVNPDDLAITFRDKRVPVRVSSSGSAFDGGDFIDFVVDLESNLYTDELPFVLSANGSERQSMGVESAVATTETAAWYWAVSEYGPDRHYNFASPTEDPWYADRLLAFPNQPVSVQVNLAVDQLTTVADFHPSLQAHLIGVTNWTNGGQDHHVQMSLGGLQVAEARYDGIGAQTISVLLPNLTSGNAQVQITATGDTGFAHDLNYLERISLRYPRLAVAAEGRLLIDALQTNVSRPDETPYDEQGGSDGLLFSSFEGSAERPGFRVSNLANGPVVAYVARNDGWSWLSATTMATSNSVLLPAETGARYYVAETTALNAPRIETAAPIEAISDGQFDYLMIVHPTLIEAVQPLADFHRANGLTVRIVDVTQIYAQYAHYVPEAQAIQKYLDAVVPTSGADYVLLVGGDTYDYKNFLGTGSVSLIPTQYMQTDEVVRHAPIDALFADPNRDGAPDFALGRLPVRTAAELQSIVTKITARTGALSQRNLVLAAPLSDSNGDFDSVSDTLAANLPGTWSTIRAYADQSDPVTARAALLSALNGSPTLLSWVGHSAPSQWSFDPMLMATDINNATGSVSDLVVQSGCWNSYFVSPAANTMAHAFLLTPNKGAAAVIGVTSLTDIGAHEQFGARLYAELVPGVRIGDAFRYAKSELAADGFNTILYSATLLGDPAMTVR